MPPIMKAMRQLVNPIISHFMSSPDLRDTFPEFRRMWPYDSNALQDIESFMGYLTFIYSAGDTAISSNEWYLSRAEAYKYSKEPQHEMFVATMRLTPRLPEPCSLHETFVEGCDIQPQENALEVFVTIRTPMDMNAPPQQPFNLEPVNCRPDDSDIWGLPLQSRNFTVKVSHGAHPAYDNLFFRVLNTTSYKLLAQMDFPPPVTPLAHKKDSTAAFEAVLAQMASTSADSSSCPSPQPLPPFVSLPRLISLASHISQDKDLHSLMEHNSYWYSSAIFFALQLHMQNNIVVPVGRKKSIIIKPNDSIKRIEDFFKKAKLKPSHYGIFEIAKIPKHTEIQELLDRWTPRWEKVNMEICTWRLKNLEAQRRLREMEFWRGYNAAIEDAEVAGILT